MRSIEASGDACPSISPMSSAQDTSAASHSAIMPVIEPSDEHSQKNEIVGSVLPADRPPAQGAIPLMPGSAAFEGSSIRAESGSMPDLGQMPVLFSAAIHPQQQQHILASSLMASYGAAGQPTATLAGQALDLGVFLRRQDEGDMGPRAVCAFFKRTGSSSFRHVPRGARDLAANPGRFRLPYDLIRPPTSPPSQVPVPTVSAASSCTPLTARRPASTHGATP